MISRQIIGFILIIPLVIFFFLGILATFRLIVEEEGWAPVIVIVVIASALVGLVLITGIGP